MIRRILRTDTSVGIAVLVTALAPLLMVQELNAQEALTVPAGLPDWTFNIPDKIQPSAVRPEGIVRAPGSAKEYEWAKVSGNSNPPDWFPDEHPPAPRSVTGVRRRFTGGAPSDVRPRPSELPTRACPAEHIVRQMTDHATRGRRARARSRRLFVRTSARPPNTSPR